MIPVRKIFRNSFPHAQAGSSPAPSLSVCVATATEVAPSSPRLGGLSIPVTHGRGRAGAQAGDDTHPYGGRVARLVALLRRVASTLRGRDCGADGSGADVGRLIARRAERVNNRKRVVADRYIAVHQALARGRV